MPSSQATAATERRNDRTLSPHTITPEPPKLKTTLKTPPKQATNPLQFVKVGPCSLYRTAQEQLQKVQEVKKIKQEIRDDPEDWQSNLDNWKSSRRKRQEHIIERVVEVKKLELEEHDRQRKRSKTFSEMMEERGHRGRKLSISLAMYNEEDANDLSDLGIGTSSGKSSVSGDTHDDTHSVLSDRDSEIDKNHSDVDNTSHENGNDSNDNGTHTSSTTESSTISTLATATPTTTIPLKNEFLNNGFHKNGTSNNHNIQEYDSATTATTSSPEPEEYNFEPTVRGYVSRVSQNLPRRTLVDIDTKTDDFETKSNGVSAVPVVKVDILKRREIFEKASSENIENKNNNNRLDFANTKSIKERLSFLERQKNENEKVNNSPRHSIDSTVSAKERLDQEKQSCEKELKTCGVVAEELAGVKPLRERLSNLEKYTSIDQAFIALSASAQRNDELSAERFNCKEPEKRTTNYFHEQTNSRVENPTPSERSSSPDSEYRAPRATFHQSLDSLDADASSGPDTFERVQSLEELDYHQTRRYPASSSSAEILNDTDREDSGIHTADASCSVSQADEPIEEEITSNANSNIISDKQQHQPVIIEEMTEFRSTIETTLIETSKSLERVEEKIAGLSLEPEPCAAVLTETGTAEISSSSSTSGEALCVNSNKIESPRTTNSNATFLQSSPRPVVYQSPRVPPRRSPPEPFPKSKLPSYLPGLSTIELTSPKDDNSSCLLLESPSESLSTPDSSSTNTICSLNFSIEPDSRNFQSTTSDQISSGSTSPQVESKPQTPLASPRSPSKIPTPLPRKTIITSPTNSTCSLPSPTISNPASPKISSPGSPKIPPPVSPKPRSPLPRSTSTTAPPSEIPVPVKVAITASMSPPTSPTRNDSADSATRRRTVVEVCEKVVVPRGQVPCTPFITVERYADETSGNTEAEQQHQQSEPEPEPVATLAQKEDQVEEVEEEEQEEEVDEEEEEEEEEDNKEELLIDMESPILVQEIVQQVGQKDKDSVNMKMSEIPAVRPTTLALERTTLCSDFLSPLSPVSKQILPLSFSSDEEIVAGLSFPLGPPTSVEPPKEKPPPPPVDLSDEENHPIEPLKRLNSTRRIKKEIRTRRSDFLGIEGFNDDEYERELTLTKPPDMAAILAEERRIEQLHRRSYDTDSNYEQDSSHERDSGVELGQAEDWTKQPVSPDMSQHSRQSSEPFGASVTSSEEDEITKKEREIIEVLEREEQWRYENNHEINSDIGEKLAHKLRELEEEKMQLELERASQKVSDNQQRRRHQEPTAETLRMNEENLRKQEELTRKQDEAMVRQQQLELEKQLSEEQRQQEEEEERREAQLRMQEREDRDRRNVEVRHHEEIQIRAVEKPALENKSMSPTLNSNEDDYTSREVLRVERELLQLEQEELKRQRNNLAYREQKQQQLAEQLQEQWKSLQDVAQAPPTPIRRPYDVKTQQQAPINYRSSMPNLQLQDSVSLGQRRRPPPPPIPPAKPLRLVEQRQRDATIRNSRIPSADSIPQQVEAPLRPSCSTTALPQQNHHGQMSRQTLQALSAVPRPRIVQADQWVQRRKSDIPRGAHDYNYQHWLIQEAEQRRINEKNQRSPARKPHMTGTSVPYTASPIRHDNKPLPDSIIQTLTQRVQNRVQEKPLSPRRRLEHSTSHEHLHTSQHYQMQQHKVHQSPNNNNNNNNNNSNNNNNNSNSSSESQEKMLSVSGKKKCSHCGDELGRGAAMIIESLRLFYHMECFKCCVCHVRLGDGLMGTDVRVRNHKLHCHNCYSSDDGTDTTTTSITHNYDRTAGSLTNFIK